MIALVEGAIRQRTPNEIALSLVLSAFTLIFLIVTAALWPMALNAEMYMKDYVGVEAKSLGTDVPTLVALLVCLIPTTIGALLAAIGIAGMDRALRANILAKSGKAVEVAGDVDTLLLDKTGTITVGNRRATQFIPLGDFTAVAVGELATLASVADQTPEGKSILDLFKRLPAADGSLRAGHDLRIMIPQGAHFVEFTAQTRMSGLDLPDGRRIRKGAPDAVIRHVEHDLGRLPHRLQEQIDAVASKGATPLLVAEGNSIAGLVVLEDVLKPGMRSLRAAPAAWAAPSWSRGQRADRQAIAEQAGVDDYIAQATPEAKLAHPQGAGVRQARRHDGRRHQRAPRSPSRRRRAELRHRAPRKPATWSISTATHQAHRVVEIGKQLLMTRQPPPLDRQRPGRICDRAGVRLDAAVAQAIRRDAPALGHVGHPVGGDFQRHRHSPADPIAEGRAVSARRCRRLCGLAHLGPRRSDRALHGIKSSTWSWSPEPGFLIRGNVQAHLRANLWPS